MRAVVCRNWGSPRGLTVEEMAEPAMIEGGLRIAVAAAGVNFADTVMIEGRYQNKPPLPFAPGMEVAGRVVETAPGVKGFKAGDRVFAKLDYGGYAEEAVADARFTWPIPKGMDMTAAAGFAVVYGTSHLALTDRAGLKAGETLLVHGAAGGVGLTAVEIGKKLGATVIATASSPSKLAVAAEHGADHLIDHTAEDVRTRVLELTGGRGAEVVYDPVGGAAFAASLRCVAWGGRIIVIGFASGTIPQVPANILLVKHIGVLGFSWGTYRLHRPDLLTDSMATLLGWYAEGALKPRVSMTFDLAEARKALDALIGRKSTGKIVLTTGR